MSLFPFFWLDLKQLPRKSGMMLLVGAACSIGLNFLPMPARFNLGSLLCHPVFAFGIFLSRVHGDGLKKDMGVASVFVMVISYFMIHFDKPLPECIGSIAAGYFFWD